MAWPPNSVMVRQQNGLLAKWPTGIMVKQQNGVMVKWHNSIMAKWKLEKYLILSATHTPKHCGDTLSWEAALPKIQKIQRGRGRDWESQHTWEEIHTYFVSQKKLTCNPSSVTRQQSSAAPGDFFTLNKKQEHYHKQKVLWRKHESTIMKSAKYK